MKPHKLLWLLCCAMCLIIACNKEIDQSAKPTTAEQASSTDNFGINPALFVEGIDNSYFPLTPGTVLHYINLINDDGELATENNIVTVTSGIKKILGVNCEVVYDIIKEKGELTEETYDWGMFGILAKIQKRLLIQAGAQKDHGKQVLTAPSQVS